MRTVYFLKCFSLALAAGCLPALLPDHLWSALSTASSETSATSPFPASRLTCPPSLLGSSEALARRELGNGGDFDDSPVGSMPERDFVDKVANPCGGTECVILELEGSFLKTCFARSLPPGGLPGMHCVKTQEPGSKGWEDNQLCTDRDMGLRWSYAGPIAGLSCTHTHESADGTAWNDNYLCIPSGSPLKFTWSSSGRPAGKQCLSFYENSRSPETGQDNFLCFNEKG